MAELEAGLLAMLPAAAIAGGDGRILAVNDRFFALTGTRAGARLQDLGPGLVSANATGIGGPVRYRRADGAAFEALASFGPAGTSDGRPARILMLVDVTERARREAELAELASFPLMNPSPVLRFDRAGMVVLANPAAERLFGRGPLAGRGWPDLCPGMTVELWTRIVADEAPPSIEATIGRETVRFDHVRAPGDRIITAFGLVTTDFRIAERARDAKAAELAELARFPDMNPGPVIRTDAAGIIVLANAAARAVFGDALAGRNWRDVCPKVADSGWDAIVAAEAVVPIEGRVAGRDFVFNHRSDRRSGFVFVYGTDITRQKKAEAALRQSEKMATLGTLAAGVTHELNNPAAATRRAADQLRGKLAELEAAHLGFTPAAHGRDAEAALAALLDRARSASSLAGALDAMAQADREAALEDWLRDRGVAEPWRFAGDLANAGIDEAALGALAGHLPGEVLTGVLSWVTSAFNVAALTHTVTQGATRLSEIVQALKGYSYLGQAPVQAVDLREGIENTLVIMRSRLKYGITVRRSYQPDLPPVPAYGSELNQVWTNIIDNAADAMGERGELTISTRAEDGYAVVEIEDNGPGIPDEIKDRIFDPFFTTKPPGKGMGLGLATTHSIVTEKHGGKIAVESRPGSTRFTVRLPLVARGPTPVAGQPAGRSV